MDGLFLNPFSDIVMFSLTEQDHDTDPKIALRIPNLTPELHMA
jgi:hypothetical protein